MAETNLKFEMAQKIARKIIENSDKFGDLEYDAKAFLENVENWRGRPWEEKSPAWKQISERLPEILEKLDACKD